MATKKATAKKTAAKSAAKKAAPKETKTVIKSSKDGEFKSKKHAARNPNTTMAMTVPVDNTPDVNEAALKRAAAAKKATKKAPAKKAATPAKKAAPAAKKAAAPAKSAPKKEQTFSATPTSSKKEQTFGTPAVSKVVQPRTSAQSAAKVPALTSTTPAKKATKKAAKHVVAPTYEAQTAWKQGAQQPTSTFGKTHGSLEAAALAAHVSPETMQARAVSKDLEFDHVKYKASQETK